jgi:hypothetical protein
VAVVLLVSVLLPLTGGAGGDLAAIQTRFYRLRTDLPPADAQDVAAFLDQMFLAYARIFGYDARRQSTLDVYLFRDREGFFAYGEERGLGLGIVQMRGLYSPDLHELSAWGAGEELREALAHEGVHQFIALVTRPNHQPPLWFHEGLAGYFEAARWQNGTLTLGTVNFNCLAELLRMRVQGHFVPVVPLRDLLTANNFSPAHYAEAWSFVYFLLQSSGGRNAELLNRYFNLIQQGEDPVQAFDASFQTPLATVDQAWRASVDELLNKTLHQLLALPAAESWGQPRR